MGPTLQWTTDPVALVLYAVAVYRLARLVTADTITERPRQWIAERGDRWSLFITCPWCTSVWLAAGWALLASLLPAGALVLGAILAWSAVAGLLSSWE